MKLRPFLVAFFFLLVSQLAYSQEVLPGLIPRFYGIEAAVDLPLSAEVAHERALSGFDLSTLDPSANTILWKPNQNTIPSAVLIEDNAQLEYVRELPSRSGQLRFTVATRDHREFTVVLSKKIHSQLLRRNILSKLGYASQPMSWLPRFNLVFRDTVDRDIFKEQMKDKLLAGTDRWIKSERGLRISMQDALVMSSEANVYNLSNGIMTPEVHQGRRILRAAYVPLALVDSTESVNLMSWQAGRIVLNHVKLNHTQDLDTAYRTSWEDARWIGRRILKLTREDIVEIVRKASFPSAVETLLIEKIISRRNDLIDLFNLTTEATKIPFDAKVTVTPGLDDGEIVQEFFEGYASRFSYGDPESPFSASELGSFAMSRVQSTLIEAGIKELNKLLGTDEQARFADRIESIVNDQGPFFPTQAIVMPTFHGNIVFSRDIVTGAYLGTNNKVQLVDNIGYSLDAGVVGAVVGLPIAVDIKAGSQINFQRVFSHVKPVQSLKKSMREPYKNMFVPMLLKNLGNKIDRLTVTEGASQRAAVMSVVADLKQALAVGESFIITDSLVPNMFAEANLSVSSLMGLSNGLLRAYGRVQTERMTLSRFHLHRPDENTFQIYQDYGKNLKLQITFKLRSYVPILGFNARWNTATAETHFYPVSLHESSVNVATLKALRQSILALNHDALQDVVTPHRIQHDMKGSANTLQFLIFKRNRIGSEQSMNLTHAAGGNQKMIHRRYDALTNGTDSEGYALEAASTLISELTGKDISISSVPLTNPGFTLGGRAKNKIFTSEVEDGRTVTQFQRILNGWRIRPGKRRSLMQLMNREGGRTIFDERTVMNTNSILLYQVIFQYIMVQEGTERLLNATVRQLENALINHPVGRVGEDPQAATLRYHRELRRINREIGDGEPADGLKMYHAWLRDFQNDVTIRGLAEIVGSDNISYQGRIEGFRQGDESGDEAIFSNVYGELPLPLHVMPTQRVMQNWGILEGELLANWMMERAI